ncbi:DNA mismatch repair ATPase msh1 [Rhizophlyctis rosea]|nr:DNA mismatch repair ATPase msh1 [Rhizophlyctis rosea]
MSETTSILNTATPKSLVIMDEVGRGTSPLCGVAIAYAVLRYLHDRCGCRTIFATHFQDLAVRIEGEGRGVWEGVEFFRTSVVGETQDGRGSIDYKIQRGITDESHGIIVARKAGLPPEVIETAGKIMHASKAEEEEKEVVWEKYRRGDLVERRRTVSLGA